MAEGTRRETPLQLFDPIEPNFPPPAGCPVSELLNNETPLQMFDLVEPNYSPAELLAISPKEASFLRNLLNRVGVVEVQRFIQSLQT